MATKGKKMPLCEEATLDRGEAVDDDNDDVYRLWPSFVVRWGSPDGGANSPLLLFAVCRAKLAVRDRLLTTIRNVTWKTAPTTTTMRQRLRFDP